jgi:hypothetical protein
MRAALSHSAADGSYGRRDEIHSPLYSPGTKTPVAVRHCGRFGAVSKTVVGLSVHRGFESLPLRFPAEEVADLQASSGSAVTGSADSGWPLKDPLEVTFVQHSAATVRQAHQLPPLLARSR